MHLKKCTCYFAAFKCSEVFNATDIAVCSPVFRCLMRKTMMWLLSHFTGQILEQSQAAGSWWMNSLLDQHQTRQRSLGASLCLFQGTRAQCCAPAGGGELTCSGGVQAVYSAALLFTEYYHHLYRHFFQLYYTLLLIIVLLSSMSKIDNDVMAWRKNCEHTPAKFQMKVAKK